MEISSIEMLEAPSGQWMWIGSGPDPFMNAVPTLDGETLIVLGEKEIMFGTGLM
jgi:hypothetical protein